MRTSTCSLDQLSMLNDLTFEMWVPNLRWIAAHRMQRKMPNCRIVQSARALGSVPCKFRGRDVRSMMPKLFTPVAR